MANFIDEYLVGLGFEVNIGELRKFEDAIRQARGLVTTETSGLASQLLKWQVAVTGGFAAIATATIATADKVAMSDQSYRLLGERMYMTTSAARSMSKALRILGVTQQEVANDPELSKRFNDLFQADQRVQEQLGNSFEKNQIGWRDAREAAGLFQIAAEGAVEKLVSALETQFQPVIEKVRVTFIAWADYITEHMPEISDAFLKHVLPILRDTADVLLKTGLLVKILVGHFVQLIGLLSGDSKLENASLTFDSMATAVEHVIHGLAKMLLFLIRIETVVAGVGGGLLNMGKELWEGLTGFNDPDYIKKLEKLNEQAGTDFGKAWGAMPWKNKIGGYGLQALSDLSAGFAGGATGAGGDLPPGMSADAKRLLAMPDSYDNPGSGTGKMLDDWMALFNSSTSTGFLSQGHIATLSSLAPIISQASKAFGIPESVIRAIITQESGGRNLAENSKHAAGIMQLMPNTAADMGVTDRMDPVQNILGGTKYFAQQMQHYGNLSAALAAYNAGPGAVDSGRAFRIPETQNYIKSIEGMLRRDDPKVEIHLNVVNPNGNIDQLGPIVRKAVAQAMATANQRNYSVLPEPR